MRGKLKGPTEKREMTFGSKFQGYKNITLIPHSSSSCVFVIVMFVWVLVPSNVSTFTTHTSIWNGDWADWARIISCLFLSAVCWIWISFLVVVFRLSLDVKVSAFQLKVSLCRGKVFSSRVVSDAWTAGLSWKLSLAWAAFLYSLYIFCSVSWPAGPFCALTAYATDPNAFLSSSSASCKQLNACNSKRPLPLSVNEWVKKWIQNHSQKTTRMGAKIS